MKRADNFCAADQLREQCANFESLIKRSLQKALPKPPEEMKRDFLALIGHQYVRRELFCSDLVARLYAGRMFGEELSKMWGRSVERAARGKLPTFFAFATFIHRDWNCSDRDAAFNFRSIRNKVGRAIRAQGLNGIAIIELQSLSNYPEKGKGRSLMANVHALVWDRKEIDATGWERTINSSSAWQTDFGCPALHVKALGEDTLDNRLNIERTVAYMVKPPCDSKFFKPQKNAPGRYKFASTVKGYAPNLALRLFECLSHIRLLEVVFGVGQDGVKWCHKWRSRVKIWQKNRFHAAELRDVDPVKFWAKYRKKSGTQKFKPFRLLVGSARGPGLICRGGENDPAQPVRRTSHGQLKRTGVRHQKIKRSNPQPRRRRGSYGRLLRHTKMRTI